MSIDLGDVFKKVVLNFNSDNIVLHQTELTGLEASLTGYDSGKFQADLKLKSHGTVKLGTWNNRGQAEAEYDLLVRKIQRGEYQLHAYSDGKFEIDFR